jgi:hypothetical protein
MLKKITIAAAALMVAGPLLAGTPVLDRHEHHQAQRIRQGIHSGELTRHESRRLIRGQYRLRAHEAIAKSDGVVTRHERASLRHQAHVQSRHIHGQKHDRQDRN